MELPLFRFLTAACCWTFVTGCLNRDVEVPDVPRGIRPVLARQTQEQPSTHNTDVLFIVDDSISMADKQRILQASLSWAQGYALSCLSVDGHQMVPQEGLCPAGYMATVVLGAVGSIGMITTSLEAGGNCTAENRSAHLFPGVADPDSQQYSSQIIGQLEKVGESGCGFEAPLEAMYRFLVDPEPPLTVTKRSTSSGEMTVAEGVDEDLLASRAAFLHPFSQVVVIFLTDEDDCSVRDDGDSWKIGAPSGSISAGVPAEQDSLNLRCWDEQRRFGEDWLFAVDRYTAALTSPTITTRSGATVANPLLGNDRTPDGISVLAIAGVPWQLVTTPTSDSNSQDLTFDDPRELDSSGAWQKILGDPARSVPPSDPHLLASAAPRPGLPLPGKAPDPISGNEMVSSTPEELQFSCIFPLPNPRDCTNDASCECTVDSSVSSPLCRQPDGTYNAVQRFAGANPPARLLEFIHGLGEAGHLGSICPRQLADPTQPGFGYSEALRDFSKSFQSAWDLACFYPALPLRDDGSIVCKLLEFHDAVIDCSSIGRTTASGPYVDRLLQQINRRDAAGSTTCEILPMPGDPRDPTSAAYACSHDAQPASVPTGYCYIDPEADLGSADLVDACTPGNSRRVRLLPRTLPVPGTVVSLICDYG